MAFKIDDLIIDSIDTALATTFEDVPLYTLTQLSEASIEITAESTDATDKNGTLIKKVWKGKSGTFSATNAMINLHVIGAMSADDGYRVATAGNKIVMPSIYTIKAGQATFQLPEYTATATLSIAEEGNNGAMGKVYEKATAASATEYAVSSSGVLTLPTDATADKFVILYKREVASGIEITNMADKFPSTVRLYVKALAYDPCTADTLRAVIIYLPSFQVSPEVSIGLNSDGATIDYQGKQDCRS